MKPVILGFIVSPPKFNLGDIVTYYEVVTSKYRDQRTAIVEHQKEILGIRYKGVGQYSGEVGYQYLISFKVMSIQDCPPSEANSLWVDESSLGYVEPK